MNFHKASSSVLGREAMRDLDVQTISAGTASLELMERAGAALADAVADSAFHGIEISEFASLLVLAGPGNNGGDGFVVARLLSELGWNCTVALVAGEPAAGGDAAVNLSRWQQLGGEVIDAPAAEEALNSEEFDLALDAIFGTGLVRPVEGKLVKLIQNLNNSGLPIIAADIPSGLCSDTGTPLGIAVQARATLAIGAAKPGLFLTDGPNYTGRVRVADIGLLDPTTAGHHGGVLDKATLAGALPRLPQLAHKGTRGHVLVIAGSRGKSGAAVLAARAALRAGAGLVTVASVAEVQAAVAAGLPEAMTLLLPSDEHGQIAMGAHDLLAAAAQAADSIVIGPGLGVGRGVDAAVAQVLAAPKCVLLDADALNVIADWEPERRGRLFEARTNAAWPRAVLTPHPGEMARLLDTTSAHVQLSRKVFADKLAQELDSVVVLKGAATVVSDGVTTAFNLSGNPGMACAGMGDVLAGAGGALLARLENPFEAACLAVFTHGAAADLWAAETGPGFLASEVADLLPLSLSDCMPR